ncbi:hypothetical protein IWW55_006324, partial [Coemansia sp. RSA 2706]
GKTDDMSLNRPPQGSQPHRQGFRPRPPQFSRNMNPPGMQNMYMQQQYRPYRAPMNARPQNRPPYNRQTAQQQQQPGQQQLQLYSRIPNGQQAIDSSKSQLQRTTSDYYGSVLRGLEMQSSGATVSAKGLPVDPSYMVDVPSP